MIAAQRFLTEDIPISLVELVHCYNIEECVVDGLFEYFLDLALQLGVE